jgi:electron transport complex protein RnfC
VIETDGRDEPLPARDAQWPTDRAAQLDAIRAGGIVGLGGAVYPTADKLATPVPCKTLIVNGAECEPYISCDDLLMRESAAAIVAGALLLTDVLDAPRCIIAIERDKPQAMEAIEAAAQAADDPRLKLAEVPTIYPAGGEKQLVELLTGEEVPSGRYPGEFGYVCQNVGTAFAVERLRTAHEPLTARIVTVTGGGVKTPQNVETPIGTPIAELIALCGGYNEEVVRLIAGGSMMGYALPDDETPITKATNCIIAATADEVRTETYEWPCIRCGDCAMVCPSRLLPQDLLVAATTNDFASLNTLGLQDCIECGCCDVICPAQIMLTERFRVAKRALALHERRTARK